MSRSVQTPSKAFAFPNEWLPVRLGSIGKTYGGLTGKSGEDFNTGSASYVTFMQVMGNSRLREPAKGTVNIKPGERQNHVQKDDLLFNGSSETPEEVALAAAVDFRPDSDTFLNSFCFGFRLLPDAPADSLYLAYLFRSSVGRNLVSSLAQGATRYNISKTQLLNQAIHLPSKAEQIAIREKLTDAEELIKSLERLISKKQAIKQGMMQELLTGRTRLPGFSASWFSSTWGELALEISSGATPRRGVAEYWNGEIPWVTSTELKRGPVDSIPQSITTAGLRAANLRVWPAGTFLMAITGLEAAGTRGKCGLLSVAAATNQSCMAVAPGPDLDTEFLFYYYLHYGNDLAFKYVQGTKQQSYTAAIVKKLPIHLPSDVSEQQAIAQVLRDADHEIAALERRLESARNIKQGMMQELLTGRTRLPFEGNQHDSDER